MTAATALRDPCGLAPGSSITTVPTPALLVDLDRLERNMLGLQQEISARGRGLRPHAKAHKSVAIMKRQLRLGAVGVAVAKTGEAEVLVDGGCFDIVVAYPVVGEEKWQRLAALARVARVGVNVESELAAHGLAAAAERGGVTLRAYLEVDTGLDRTGIAARDIEALAKLGRSVAALPGLELAGVTTYRGLSFATAGRLSPDEAGVDEGTTIAAVAEQLRRGGLRIDEVAAGSTATARAVSRCDGVSEVRAGAYLFHDGAQIAAGTADRSDVALTVVATVISLPRPGHAVIDAGSKTFGATALVPDDGPPIFARALDGEHRVVRLSEEHGVVQLGDDDPSPALGDRLQFIPHHASASVNLADELIGVRDRVVSEIFTVDARGRRT